MLEILSSNTKDNFFKLIKEANKEIYLCAPFIKENIVNQILLNKKENVKLTVITSNNIGYFLNKSVDISAIKKLINNNVKVFNYNSLHAKIYLIDNNAIITSANLTNNAMYNNYEYGFLLNDETCINQIHLDFINMINDNDCSQYNMRLINSIEKEIRIHKKEKNIITIDNEDDALLIIKNINKLSLTKWQKDVFNCLNLIPNNTFKLNDIYSFETLLKDKHPRNNNIQEKIRQILQQLRDLGYIKFINRGQYKKLWINNLSN